MKRDDTYLIGNQFAAGNAPNATAFKKGEKPWNAGMKGWSAPGVERTQFKKGARGPRWKPVGTVTIRKDKGPTGKLRAWVKAAEPNVWKLRAVVVWEQHNGAIPAGLLIHHEDRNSLNDAIGNLRCLTRSAHLTEHRAENEDARRAGLQRARTAQQGMVLA